MDSLEVTLIVCYTLELLPPKSGGGGGGVCKILVPI